MTHRRNILRLTAAAMFAAGTNSMAQVLGSTEFSVHAFGATGNSKTNDTQSIQKAIDAAAAAGGGVIYFPPGIYLSSGIELKSNVYLNVAAGATILGSTILADYRTFPGMSSHGDGEGKYLIFARGAENIGIYGYGVIDGQGSSFWLKRERPGLRAENLWRDVVASDWQPLPRPSPSVLFLECRNVHVNDITIRNSACWTLMLIACDTVVVKGVTIRNPIYAPNTDGIDLISCQNALIANCDIATGDDAICVKSDSFFNDLRLSKNIIATNCLLTTCCNGFKLGTNSKGGFENITFSNSTIYNYDAPINARVIAGVALEVVDGGWIDGISISDIRMKNVRTPIFVRLGNRGNGQRLPQPGTLKNVSISNIQATGSILTSSITGLPDHPVENLSLNNIEISTAEAGEPAWAANVVPEKSKEYPEARMFGRLPCYALYCRHVDGLRISRFRTTSTLPDGRSFLVCDDVQDMQLDNVSGVNASSNAKAFFDLRNVRKALIRDCQLSAPVEVFARVAGSSSEITLIGNDVRSAKRLLEATDGASEASVVERSNVTATAQ